MLTFPFAPGHQPVGTVFIASIVSTHVLAGMLSGTTFRSLETLDSFSSRRRMHERLEVAKTVDGMRMGHELVQCLPRKPCGLGEVAFYG